MNFYIVTFDRKAGVSYKDFHDDFVNGARINRWWHYIQSCYIVGTEAGASEVSEHFTRTAEAHGIPTTHLVLAVDLKKRQGMLIKDAWDWLRKNAT